MPEYFHVAFDTSGKEDDLLVLPSIERLLLRARLISDHWDSGKPGQVSSPVASAYIEARAIEGRLSPEIVLPVIVEGLEADCFLLRDIELPIDIHRGRDSDERETRSSGGMGLHIGATCSNEEHLDESQSSDDEIGQRHCPRRRFDRRAPAKKAMRRDKVIVKRGRLKRCW